MKKRLKLFFSIFASCLAIFALCFGVYASVKVKYQVSGTVHYKIDNAYVDIETRVYSSNKLLDYVSGGSIVNALRDVDLEDMPSTASSNGLTLKSRYTQTSLGEEFNSSLSTSLQNITYSSTNGYAYFIVVNVKNKTSEIVSAIIEDNITLPDNSWCINTGYITGFDNTTTNNNFIFAFGLDNAGTEIESTQFNFVLDIDLGELQPTTTKYIIDETAKTLKINSDATGVVVIGKGNSTATNLTLSSQSTNISHVYCFDDCGITSLSTYAFNNCTQLTEMIIPSGIQTIQYGAIRDCNALTEIVIPNSVKSIGSGAFDGCSGLTEISIPAGIQSISEGAFANFSGLEQITVEDGNTVYYSENNCIIETSTKTLILGCKNSVIPEDVKNIGYYAFSRCTGLTEITIPASVESIGQMGVYTGSGGSFLGCTSLTKVIIEEGLINIGNAAFYGCTGLTEIILPASVTSIGEYAFCGCTGLTEITIPASVESIGNSAFYRCSNLNNVTIDKLSIANGISSNTSQEYLVNYLKSGGTVKVKCTDISEVTSTYLQNSSIFTQPTSVVDGYAIFIKI